MSSTKDPYDHYWLCEKCGKTPKQGEACDCPAPQATKSEYNEQLARERQISVAKYETLNPQATKPVDEQASDFRSKVIEAVCFKPHITGHLEQFERIEALLTEARIDEVKRMNEIANRSQMQTASKFKMYNYMAERLAQLKNERSNN